MLSLVWNPGFRHSARAQGVAAGGFSWVVLRRTEVKVTYIEEKSGKRRVMETHLLDLTDTGSRRRGE